MSNVQTRRVLDKVTSNRQPTVWLHILCLKALTVHALGNELRLFMDQDILPTFAINVTRAFASTNTPPPLILKLFHIIENYLHGFRVILVGPWQSMKKDTESLWGLLAMPEAVGISIQVFLPGIVVIF